jgi:flagellar biosynthesis/type III secretory pathway M-ring protein FliF/YscJ
VKTNPYTLPLQNPGKRNILVQAYDKAGNYTATLEEFIIKETEKPIVVEKQPAFLKLGAKAASFLVLAIVLVALLISFILIFWYGWRRLSSLKKKVKKETNEAEKALQTAFNLLRQNVRKQIKILESAKARRQLTKEEEEIIKHFRQDLDRVEKSVRKEIKDIEKEVK